MSQYILPFGGFVYCRLYGFEHSGISTHNNQIIELERDGIVKKSTCDEFLRGTGSAKILIAGSGNRIILDPVVAELAEDFVLQKRGYNLLFQNCHNFVATAITQDLKSRISYFFELNRLIAETYHCPTLEWHSIYSSEQIPEDLM
jgi:hypothetical protein